MKNRFFLFLLVSSFLLSIVSCKKDKPTNCIPPPICGPFLGECFKGRLEIQDICGNYTIKLLEGNISTNLIQASWTHPKTNITYKNVFSLGNICNFPASIKQGDEFYFQIRDTKKDPNCVQCLAYAPTPDKTLSITVSSTPCGNTK